MKLPIKIACASIASEFGQTATNLATMFKMIEEAAAESAQLICFPEVSLQGYHTDRQRVHREAETADGPSCSKLIEAAKQYDMTVSVGMALRVDDHVYNAQVYLDKTGPLGYSTKVHICGEEGHLFDPGNDWPVIDLGFAKIGTVICFDAEFPEAARCLALEGADIILMSFATGRCDSCGRPQDPLNWADQVLTWAPARAYENRVFVVAVNHAGDVEDKEDLCGASWVKPGEMHRWPGYSFVVSPSGEVIAESARDHNQQRLLVADLDPADLLYWRSNDGDLIKYRRPETYGRMGQGV
jgi:predicted amidohydrolase